MEGRPERTLFWSSRTMAAKSLLSFVFLLTSLSQMGCAGCLHCARNGGCDMCGPACGCPDCGCADTCCDVGCGCADPGCGCVDPGCGCVDPCCGAPGCGTMVGHRRPLANCPLLVGLRNLFCGTGCGCGCGGGGGCSCGGCGCETYTGDWNCNPPCAEPCDQCGNYNGAQAGMQMGQMGMPMARRPYVAERVRSDEINFSSRQQSLQK